MTATAHTDVPSTSDDLATEILRRRRKKLPRLTAALALAVALGAGIVGGIEIQKHYGGSSTTAGTTGGATAFASRLAGGRTGGFGFGGFGRFGGGAGGGTAGTVTLIKGSTLYVTEPSGNTVVVHTSPSSRVTKSVSGTVQTIHPGDAVTVTGAQAANGSYTASTITIAGAAGNG
jgi:hypothetical protein